MPLSEGALDAVCAQLEAIARGERVHIITIGDLLPDQVALLNRLRESLGLPIVGSELVFLGRHIYRSRIAQDGYTVADVRAQLASALHETALVQITGRSSTIMQATSFREDGRGNQVRDEAVFELSSRTPRIEVYSVIPKGDKIRPRKLPL
jgi:hypothetical protein